MRLFPCPMKHPDIVRQGFVEGNPLHNFLVALYHVARVPLPLTAILVGLLLGPPALLYPHPATAALLLGGATLGDLTLLILLPRLGQSHGWVQPPWLLFTLGRALLALPPALLPPPWSLVLLGASQLLLSLLSLYGSLVEPFRIEHTRLTVAVEGLTATVHLLLLTDLHMERTTRRERAALQLIREARPDLILVGGDLLSLSYVGDPEAMRHARLFLGQLAAPAGVFYARGTVDVDPPAVVGQILDGLSIQTLDDEHLTLQINGTSLTLLGIPADGPMDELRRRLERVMERAPPPVVCLHHTPDLVEDAARLGVAVYLAGHTHGGQICLPLLGPIATASRFGRRYVRGLHQVDRTAAYVCRGLGLEGLGAPRIRFLARPELVSIILAPPPAAGPGPTGSQPPGSIRLDGGPRFPYTLAFEGAGRWCPT